MSAGPQGGTAAQPAGGAAAGLPSGGERRRIVLMRHGSVDYFRDDGTPVSPEGVPLSELGRRQASAAGGLFAQCGVRFDRVVASGLARTLETAALALAACGQSALEVEIEPALQEIRGGRLSAIPRDQLVSAFLGAFGDGGDDGEDAGGIESRRFLGGESVGELLDRVLPAFERLLARDDWHTLLLVLHGAVNRALLSHALAGGRTFLGRARAVARLRQHRRRAAARRARPHDRAHRQHGADELDARGRAADDDGEAARAVHEGGGGALTAARRARPARPPVGTPQPNIGNGSKRPRSTGASPPAPAGTPSQPSISVA